MMQVAYQEFKEANEIKSSSCISPMSYFEYSTAEYILEKISFDYQFCNLTGRFKSSGLA